MKTATLLLAMCLACGCACAQSNPAGGSSSANASHSERSLPEDRHGGMSVSADPYTDTVRAKQKFGKANPLPRGILPVEVSLRNETTSPIHIDLDTIQLDIHQSGGQLEGLDSLSAEDVAKTIAHPNGPPAPKTRRFPIGVSTGADSKTQKLLDILMPLALEADIVPPMGMIHGFLFFNIDGDLSLTAKSSLYVPDVTIIPSKKPLIFFEVPLGEH
jgi:hypothetical protein